MTGFKHIVEFIESSEFKTALIHASNNFEILSEADLQVFVCRKLFEFFAVTPNLRTKYRANAQPFCSELAFYPDIAIFRRRNRVPDLPAIAIELKEGHSFGAAVEHDCRKLRMYRASIRVRRAYLIHLVHSGDEKDFWCKFKAQRNGLKNIVGIPIILKNELASGYEQWHERRKSLVRAFQVHPKSTKSRPDSGAS